MGWYTGSLAHPLTASTTQHTHSRITHTHTRTYARTGPNRGAAAVVVDNDGATAAVACPVEQPLSPPPTTTPKRTPAYRKMFPHKVALGVDRFAKTAMFHLPARYKHPVMLSSGAYGMVISAIDTVGGANSSHHLSDLYPHVMYLSAP